MSIFDVRFMAPIAVIVLVGVAAVVYVRQEWLKIVGTPK